MEVAFTDTKFARCRISFETRRSLYFACTSTVSLFIGFFHFGPLEFTGQFLKSGFCAYACTKLRALGLSLLAKIFKKLRYRAAAEQPEEVPRTGKVLRRPVEPAGQSGRSIRANLQAFPTKDLSGQAHQTSFPGAIFDFFSPRERWRCQRTHPKR